MGREGITEKGEESVRGRGKPRGEQKSLPDQRSRERPVMKNPGMLFGEKREFYAHNFEEEEKAGGGTPTKRSYGSTGARAEGRGPDWCLWGKTKQRRPDVRRE